MGILFFLQQNLVSVGIAISLYLVLRSIISHSLKSIRQLAVIALGAVVVLVLFLAVMAIQGILPGFWDGAFVYGLIYSNLGLMEQLKALGDTLQFFISIPLLLISLLVWFLAFILLLFHETGVLKKILLNRWTGWVLLAGGVLSFTAGMGGNLLPGSQGEMGLLQRVAVVLGVILTLLAFLQLIGLIPGLALSGMDKVTFRFSPDAAILLTIVFLWYPIEIIMVTLSGRSYLHYYMAICAICCVLYAFLADQICKLLVSWKITRINFLLAAAWFTGILLTLLYNPINTMQVMYAPEGAENNQIWNSVRYILGNTRPDDKVLVWGAEPVINFLSERSSPIRYTYVYTFYTKGYGGKARSAELLSEIQVNKPLLIIYTGDTPFVNIHPDQTCTLPSQHLLAGMENVMEAICDNYHYVGLVDSTDWKIYRLNQ